MEPRGCNRWQSTANRLSAKAAKASHPLRPLATSRVRRSMVRRGSTVRVRQRAYSESRSRCKRRFFVADQDTVDHLLDKEGIEGRGGSTTRRDAGNHQQFLGAPTALRSWGQVLGTNDGWLRPNGSSARAIDAE